MSRVTQVAVPAQFMGLPGSDRVDYADAFAAETAVRRRPEQWARLVTGTSPMVLGFVLRVHKALGLRLSPPETAGHLAGWEILQNGPEEIVLGVAGGIVTPRIVVSNPPGQVIFATLIRFEGPAARAVWAVVGPVHRVVARYLLHRATSLAAVESGR